MKKLWENYYECLINSIRISLYEADLCQDLDDYDLFAQDFNKFKKSANQNKYKNYIAEKLINISDFLLFWWLSKTQRECWSKLSQMIINILLISAMSAESEWVFSEAWHTISWERMKLEEKTIKKTECLKSWMHSDFIRKIETEYLKIKWASWSKKI